MKNLKNLGKTLSKNEQKTISGGFGGGGSSCTVNNCSLCGGTPEPNGTRCLGTEFTANCLAFVCGY